MFGSRYMPCSACGASVERQDSDWHECDHERRLDYRIFQLRQEIELLEQQLAAYLNTTRPYGDSGMRDENAIANPNQEVLALGDARRLPPIAGSSSFGGMS